MTGATRTGRSAGSTTGSTGASAADPAGSSRFSVHLDNFEGPFDLLLGLIHGHRLDVTEIALSRVTDEFLAHTRELGRGGDLEQVTQFLLVAATLLDLKGARLLPQAEVEDEEDLALLEARDLLFARLLQYRAFKQVAAVLAERWEGQQRRHPRAVGLEPRFAALLPEIVMSVSPTGLAELAARALTPRAEPVLSLAHVHAPAVSVREQAGVLVDRLRREGRLTFRSLTADAPDTLTTVARFLALLELVREGVVGFDQVTPLGELHVHWTGGQDEVDLDVGDEYAAAGDPSEPSEPTATESTEDHP